MVLVSATLVIIWMVQSVDYLQHVLQTQSIIRPAFSVNALFHNNTSSMVLVRLAFKIQDGTEQTVCVDSVSSLSVVLAYSAVLTPDTQVVNVFVTSDISEMV